MTTIPQSTVSSMFDLAAEFLQVVVAAMGSTEAGTPDRAFVYPGAIPAFESQCAQAAVSLPALGEEGTGPYGPAMQLGRRFLRGRVNLVTMTGWAVRCIDISEGNQDPYEVLTDATLNEQSKAVYEDGWAIWEVLTSLLRGDLVFGGPCGDVHFGPGRPIDPQGGLAGWQFPVQIELAGYRASVTFPPVMP